MGTLDAYKGIQVVNDATGAGGIALTNSLKVLADHEDGDGTDHSGLGQLDGVNIWSTGNTFTGNVYTSGDIEYQDTFWDDLRVPVLSTKKGGSKEPVWTKIVDNDDSSQGVFTYVFSASTEQELYFACQMPHCWKESSDIHAHVHWLPTANGGAGEDVSWGLEYSWADINEVFGNTNIIYGDVTKAAETLVQNKHYLTELGVITASGKTFSSMLLCRIFRDATGAGGTDDFGDTAGLLEIDFHYEIDSPGTSEEYVK